METNAHYALVGFIAIAILSALALFAVWLGQVRFDQEYKEFDIVFEGPVRGLTDTSEVRFNGIQVGEVLRLRLDPDNPSFVIARVRMIAETPVTRGSYAQLEPQGITGLSYIQINAGEPDSEPLVSRPNEVPVLPSRAAQLDTLISSGEDIALAATEAMARINTLLSPENVEAVSETIGHIERLSGMLGEDDENGLIPRANRAIEQVEAAAGALETFASENVLVLPETVTMIEETTQASIDVSDAAVGVTEVIDDARAPVSRFANEGLDELTLAIADLRTVLAEIRAIAQSVEDDPAAFVSGGRREEVEIPR
ncbi:MAG: MlaD family protein [Maricaulaceae bacterium]|jgi:phospholipid/cholesterol/gamma-HCH transport system substrate-binding protein